MSARTTVSAEGLTQVAIMLAIGGAAGAASFTHVHDVAASHGQPGWLAWADAVVLELMSAASGLEMRRRKRSHTPVGFPAAVLVVAMALSLSAQVVDAEASAIGWTAAAIPALGFLVMVKIALAQAPPPGVSPIADELTTLTAPSASAQANPARTVATADPPDAARRPAVVVGTLQPEVPQPASAKAPELPSTSAATLNVEFLPVARVAADALASEGQRVSRQALADALRARGHAVSNARASELLRLLKAEALADGGSEVRRRFRPIPRGDHQETAGILTVRRGEEQEARPIRLVADEV